ncbi:hypothetical protein LH464_10055 [Neorhizobium sp. T786]|uniref:hypothetical protein n=1 Tax=Pseudorhizobium xiangyangii TaxID=2883104 RepID=UPI001CFFE0A6|nr:hypothetical protein [Neorhizobium xiangyangii]MCB5202817.1 hypothetical protein [Neorhizobium xiangyangii]
MTRSSVEIVSANGEYLVRVTEDDNTCEVAFSNEEFARSYAAGQSIRLNLSNDCDEMSD